MIEATATAAQQTGDFALGVDGFTFADLFRPDRLADLAEAFYRYLAEADSALAEAFARHRRDPDAVSRTQESELLLKVAPHQSAFVARLFNIEDVRAKSIEQHNELDPIYRYKKELVIKRALKKYGKELPAGKPDVVGTGGLMSRIRPDLLTLARHDEELAVAKLGCDLLDLENAYAREGVTDEVTTRVARLRQGQAFEGDDKAWVLAQLDELDRWSAVAYHERHHHGAYQDWVAFKEPEDFHWPDGLVKVSHPRPELPNAMETPEGTTRLRYGFKLTDPRWNLRETLDHTHYCMICHERDKDSCSRGLPLPRKDKPVQKNPLGVTLNGCPLDEHISEMHLLKRQGDTIAALSMVVVDNPMCPTTGHRICNDCMKACIFQKQEPVNIPQIETRVLTDTLNLPWGVEIYGLLTRWNPINVRRPYSLPYNGKNVMVVGLGPAGFALSQYLMNEGFGVVGIDGLKIEPLPAELMGGNGRLPRAIKNFSEITDELDERVSYGFGGVAEYGITIRWDKNFLKLIYMTLMRRQNFTVMGGIRFGGTVTAEDAWALGFHHVAIAAGAGKPSLVQMKNNLIPGIRKASDFLMALQLSGAYKKFAVSNLQVRLPIVVIGGGLTGVDTATESMAYYSIQCEKMLERFEEAVAELGEDAIWARMNPEEKEVLTEFLTHGRAIRAERQKAAAEGRPADVISLVRKWGGSTLVYRKRMQDAPAYRLNHEEIIKGLEEGITYVDCLDPREAVPDQYGWVKSLKFEKMVEEGGEWKNSGEIVELPARTVLVAAGTSPNVIYEKEQPGRLELDPRGRFFKGYKVVDGKLAPAAQTQADPGFFTSYNKDGHFISFYGDNHPLYAGSVVKAVASGKYGALKVAEAFARELAGQRQEDQPKRDEAWKTFVTHLKDQLQATVVDVLRLTPTIIEVVLRAPQQAKNFQPGMFYRFQNYESNSMVVNGAKLQMEGIALTGAWVDKEKGLLSLIALELGVSSRLCGFLKKGEEVVVMGPTGFPSEVGTGENVLLFGGGLGNAVLFSIARAMKDAGNKVLYIAGYKNPQDLFHRDDIEAACDTVIWAADVEPAIPARRPQDRSFVGNIVQAALAYAKGELGDQVFPLDQTHRILAIGSDRMMAAVRGARYGVLQEYLNPDHTAIASINSPMQCMMKEVCAQCLQRHVDPKTGKESYVFTCFNQDQLMDNVDWKHLNERLRQNTVQEKVSNLWLDAMIKKHSLTHV